MNIVTIHYLLLTLLVAVPVLSQQQPDVADIVKRSAEANDRDFAAEANFNYKETDKVHTGTRTVQVTFIDGTPYERLIAINGEPLNEQQASVEERKRQSAVNQRKSQSESARRARVNKYRRSQQRDHLMISQLSSAFEFKLIGEDKLRGFAVWVLKATPKPGYQPPTMQAQVLPGMQGTLWIDKATYEWVKVAAEVIGRSRLRGFSRKWSLAPNSKLRRAPWQPEFGRSLTTVPKRTPESSTYSITPRTRMFPTLTSNR